MLSMILIIEIPIILTERIVHARAGTLIVRKRLEIFDL